MKKAKTIITFIGVFVLLFSYGNPGNGILAGSPDFRQTNINTESNENDSDFKTVKIGNQEWMAENLNLSNFRNGDPIPEAKTNEDWLKGFENSEPAWCYYDYDPENGEKYGKLYNWYAVNDPKGLAPAGWHVPSDAEWTQLTDYLGGNNIAGTKMKSTSGWEKGGNGTNESGFAGLPGGARNFSGSFHYIGDAGYWWSSTELSTFYAWPRFLHFLNGNAERNNNIYYSKGLGMSVRLLRN